MSTSNWFFHLSGEVLGPFSTTALTKMIQANRVNAGDYIYSEGMDGWARVADCEEFAGALPTTPRVATPATDAPPAKLRAVPAEEKAAPPPKVEAKKAAPTPAPPKAEAKKPAPAPAPAPVEAKPQTRAWRVPIDATVKINGGGACKVFDISEGGLLFEKNGNHEMGADVKLKIESPSLGKALELTGIIVRDDTFEGKPAVGAEFTRMNPAHKRSIAQYVNSKLDLGDNKAA